MPYASLKLMPGVNVEKTKALNEAGVSESQLIRYRDGLIEKLGGWIEYLNGSFARVSALHAYQNSTGEDYLAIGTETGLYVYTGGGLSDISPFVLHTEPLQPLSSSNGARQITIIDPVFSGYNNSQMGALGFQRVVFSGALIVGGTIVEGSYPNPTISGGNIRVLAAVAASATETNSGNPPLVRGASGTSTIYAYNYPPSLAPAVGSYINILTDMVIYNQNVPAGFYYVYARQTVGPELGEGFMHIDGVCTGSLQPGVPINNGNASISYYFSPPRTGSTPDNPPPGTESVSSSLWSLDNWGTYLVACPCGGGIYYSNPDDRGIRAKLITAAPVSSYGMFVAMPQAIMVAYGCSIGDSIQVDPLLLRWSDAGNFDQWTADATNQAGSFRVPNGNQIVGGIQGPVQALIFTDLDVWGMSYIGTPFIWSFNILSTGCGLIGKNAVCRFGSGVYWMSQKQFFRLDGSGNTTPIPCSVWDVIFQNINRDQIDKVVAAPNSQFNEITWYYPSANSAENDSFVKYNVVSQAWDYGSLGRTAWIDQSILGSPIAAEAGTNLIVQHEESLNAIDKPLVSSFTTGWFALSESRDIPFIDQIEPDFIWSQWNNKDGDETGITITLYACDWLGAPVNTVNVFTSTRDTPFLSTRVRARFISFKFESSDINSFWRLGNIRYRYNMTGRR